MGLSRDAVMNRRAWDRTSDEYQEKHAPQLNPRAAGWGVWQIPERRLRVLEDVRGKDVLELGCGGAQWSIWLARRGARPIGLDNSARQLEHARRLMGQHRVSFPLVHASAEHVPLPDETFDIVFCDHGAMTFTDPRRTVREASRLLRPGGLLAFNMTSPLADICWSDQAEQVEDRLHLDYFGVRRFEHEGQVIFQLPYGAWIRLLRANGFVVEDLIELRPPPGATTTYEDFVPYEWARRWPAENIWKARKEA